MQRNNSLDALRGLAILAMVLSSSIAFGILPGWMYHAQTPPPGHVFNPSLPGITWVDLVFPFFLFSMGAAIPLAMHKRMAAHPGFWPVAWIAARRYLLLVFFALFTVHARSGSISDHPYPIHYLLSITAFVLLFFQFYKPAGSRYGTFFLVVRMLAFGAAALMLYLLPFKDGKGFSLDRSDIIIIVLGNMAFFGTLIWYLTRHTPSWRIALLPFLMALILGAREPGSWNEQIAQWSPLPWMYKFYYLKYLFLIIPGTLAGEWLLQQQATPAKNERPTAHPRRKRVWTFLSIAIIVINLILLFGRHLQLNLILTALLCITLLYSLRQQEEDRGHLLRLFGKAGVYLLLLGLFFEAFEGGIKKDPSTFSYYLVTGGLAFLLLIFFTGFQDSRAGVVIIHYLSLNGRNPMVAYVTGNLLLLPLLHLTGGMQGYTALLQHKTTGILGGLLFTGLVSLVTVWFTKKGWYWRT